MKFNFEIKLKQFMIEFFLNKTSLILKKIGSKKFFNPLETLKKKSNFTFETRIRSRLFVPFPHSNLESALYLDFSR